MREPVAGRQLCHGLNVGLAALNEVKPAGLANTDEAAAELYRAAQAGRYSNHLDQVEKLMNGGR